MANTFWTALATSLVAALVTSLGICTIRRFADWGQRSAPAYYRGKFTNVKLSDFAGKWVMLLEALLMECGP